MQQEVFGPILPVLEIESVDEAIAGNSGMGKYHGEWGFRAYTNARGVLHSLDDDRFRRPLSALQRARWIFTKVINVLGG